MSFTPKYLLDTNIWSYLQRKTGYETLKNRFQNENQKECGMSGVTYAELISGCLRLKNTQGSIEKVNALAERHSLVLLQENKRVYLQYGRIRAALMDEGKIIGNNDLWIAAHAAALGCVMVTNNVNEFSRVAGLVVEDWTQ